MEHSNALSIIKEAKNNLKSNPEEADLAYQTILEGKIKTVSDYLESNSESPIKDSNIKTILQELETC